MTRLTALALRDGSRRAAQRARLAGILLVSLSTLVFGFGNALAKYLTRDYPIGEALAVRAGFALLLLLPFVSPAGVVAALRANPRLHLLRMLISSIEIAAFYLAVAVLPLANVSTFYLSSPILLTALSAITLGERVDAARWIALLAGFAGVLVALRPGADTLSWASLIALTGAVLYAVFLTITRRLRATNGRVMVALQIAALFVAGAVTLPFAWTTPNPAALALMAGVGLLGMAGYFCINTALQRAPASVIAPFQYLSIVWAIVLGYLTFGDVPDAPTLIGAALIVAAGGFILYRERMERSA